MISGIVLAAGSSSRLGMPKQLLDLGGRSVLQRVLDSVGQAGLDEIVVVLGHQAERIRAALVLPAHARVIVNPDYRRGQSSSLRAGVAAVDPGAEAVAVFLGDQPGLAPGDVVRVLDAFRSGRRDVVRARFHDVPAHPVVVARRSWELLFQAEGDQGARERLAAGADVHEVFFDAPAPTDIDTWEQYERARAELPGG